MNRKFLILLISLVALFLHTPFSCFSQTVQMGYVFEKDSHGSPIANVEIIAKEAVPSTSGIDGKFKLVFKKKSIGEMIFIDSISKTGYEFVNGPQLKTWILTDKKDLNIIVCREGLLKKSREHLYDIGKSHYESEYKRKRSEIESLKVAEKISEKEYNKSLKELFDENQKAVEQLNYYSDLFSRINTDDLSEIENEAFKMLQDGLLDEAIQVYERENLLEKFIKNDSLKDQFSVDLESMVPSIRRYAELCAFAGGKENYEKAEKCYEAIAMSDTLNFEYVLGYAIFLSTQMKVEKKIDWFNKSLCIARDVSEKISLLYLLQESYISILNTEKAEQCCIKIKSLMESNKYDMSYEKKYGALNTLLYCQFDNKFNDLNEIKNKYANTLKTINAEVKENDLKNLLKGITFFNYSLFQLKISNINDADDNNNKANNAFSEILQSTEEVESLKLLSGITNVVISLSKKNKNSDLLLVESIKKCNDLYLVNPARYGFYLFIIKFIDGFLKEESNLIEEADSIYTEVISISREISRNDSLSTKVLTARVLSEYARFNHEEFGRFHKAQELYDEAEVIYRELLKVRELNLLSEFAEFLSNDASNLLEIKQLNRSNKYYKELLSIYEYLKESNPIFRVDYANALADYAYLCSLTKKKEEAEQMYEKSIALYRTLAKSESTYISDLALALSDYAYQFSQIDQIEKFEQMYEESIALFRNLVKTDSTYISDLAHALSDYAYQYSPMGKTEKFEQMYEESIALFRNLVKSDSTFTSDLAYTLSNYAYQYSPMGKTEKFEQIYEESIALFRNLVKSDSTFISDLAGVLFYYAYSTSMSIDNDKKERLYEETINIFDNLVRTDTSLSSDYAIILAEYASILKTKGKTQKAEQIYEKSICIFINNLESDPKIIIDYATLIESYFDKQSNNERREALIRFYQDLLSIQCNIIRSYPNELSHGIERIVSNYQYIDSSIVKHINLNQGISKKIQMVDMQNESISNLAILLEGLSPMLSNLSMLNEAIEMLKDAISIYEELKKIMNTKTDVEYLNNAISSAYGSISFYQIKMAEFKDAEFCAINGIRLNKLNTWIYTNLAHALLFQNKFDKAKEIYLKWENTMYPQDTTKTFKYFFLQDFDEFEKVGITHPDIAKIRELLK